MGWFQRASAAVRERIGSRPENAGARQVPLQMPHQAPAPSDTQGWFGPGDPPNPGAPADVAGRRMDYQPGINMLQQPRQYEPIGFGELRALADGHDLLRIIIETRKDQIARMRFSFGPRDEKVKMPEGSELAVRAKKYTDLFRRPDRKNFWGDWLRAVLEDLLVIDAPSIHVRRTLGGELYSLDQIDGATIKRVVDDAGRTPEPPFCAYQQILKGLPAVNYSEQDLIYRPRNLRVHKMYGYSPVEQIIMTVNIALRRQMWQLAYFTDGNIPDSLIGVPSTWTPDQIKQFQDWFDSLLQGNTGRRRGGLFVPGEVAKSYVPTKEAEIFGSAEEWLARVICYCFGVSHQALVKEVNRATAETAMEQAMQDGMAPILSWVKGLIDAILIDFFQEEEIEFKWEDDKELDPKVQAEIHTSYFGKILTINEIRDDLGLDPDPSPVASILGTISSDGTFVPVDPELAIQFKQKAMEAFTLMGLGPDGKPIPKETDEFGNPIEEDEEDPDAPPPPGGKKKPKAKPGKDSAGVAATAGGEGGSGSAEKLSSASLAKGLPATSPLRPKARRIRVTMQKKVARVLASAGDDIAAQVETILAERGVRKAEEGEMTPEEIAILIDSIMASLEFGALDALMDVTYDDLLRMAQTTGHEVLASLGVLDRDELVDRVNDSAVEYARARSAELVGRRVLDDGTIIDNPNPKWAITESTRTMVRDTIAGGLADNVGSDTIIEMLQEGYAFSPQRAEMVSRTEIAMANSDAAMVSMREAEGDGLSLRKEWILGPNPCDICQENADAGAIELGEDFPSGDDTVPAHPNCECAVIAIVEDEAAGTVEETEE